MKKILAVSILLAFVLGSTALARSPRWNALGGDHRFIMDDTNYSLYPGSVTMFGNEVFIIPEPRFLNNDVTGGALLNVTENMTLGFHYNLVSPGASNLRGALAGLSDPDELDDAERDLRRADEGTAEWLEARKYVAILSQNERLAGFNVRPFPDLIWGIKMENLGLGARLSLAKDSVTDNASTFEELTMGSSGDAAVSSEIGLAEEISTKATALDLSIGASVYEMPMGDLDLGVSVGIQSFSGADPNNDIEINSTGGLDLAVNARLNMDWKENRTLIPLLGLNIGSLPSPEYDEMAAPNVTEVSYMNGELGIGCRRDLKEGGLLVVGLLGGYDSTTYKPTITTEKTDGADIVLEKKELPETTDTSLNATLLAGSELPVTKWLVMRGGVSAKFSYVNDEMIVQTGTEDFVSGGEADMQDVVGNMKSTAVDYDYNIGLRTTHRGMIIDVLLARNMIHRGPYFLTGATGSWGTSVCMTYKF